MSVLNGWMLIGLATIVAPLLIHLFARRSPPVIDWGAMQFLPSVRRTQRTVMLHDPWLLLVRAIVVALLVIALARPWISGAGWPLEAYGPPRDVAVIIDGSASTARMRDGRSIQSHLHAEVRQLIRTLPRGSTVQLYDARDATVPLVPQRSQSGSATLAALDEIAPPTGSSNLADALAHSIRDLWEGQHPHREIVVLTDKQAWPWHLDEAAEWSTTASLWQQSAIKPRVSVIVHEADQPDFNDVGWSKATLSRERAVPGQSTTLTGELRNGTSQPQQRRVWCEVNGRPSADHQREVRLLPGATATITLDVTLPHPGRHALRLCTEADTITGNDRIDFLAEVIAGMKVLLVDGTPASDPLRSEVFFARAALENSGTSSWIEPRTIAWNNTPPEDLSDVAAIVLANVPQLNAEWTARLQSFVARGGAVVIALGDRAEEAFLPADQRRWLPIESVASTNLESMTQVDGESFSLPWLSRFSRDQGGELAAVEFRRWWTVALSPHAEAEGPQIGARFQNGDPWLLAFRRGRGTVVIVTSPIDADGNTLPAKPDYVAWLHELLLAVSAPAQPRNIASGALIPIPLAMRRDPLHIMGPWGSLRPSERQTGQSVIPARWPGLYVFEAQKNAGEHSDDAALQCGSTTVEAFAAQTDLREFDNRALTEADRAALTAAVPLRFVAHAAEWAQLSATDVPRRELAGGLLWCMLIGLMVESIITCRRSRREQSAGPSN